MDYAWIGTNYCKNTRRPLASSDVAAVLILWSVECLKRGHGNEFFKGSASPKDISLIDRGASLMTVFEGFMDFLSYLAIYQNQLLPLTNFVVLNSLAYFEKTLPILDKYPAVHLYLDNDPAGKKHTTIALGRHSRYEDFSRPYEHYKDLNEWLMYPGHLKKSDENQKTPTHPEAGFSRPTDP